MDREPSGYTWAMLTALLAMLACQAAVAALLFGTSAVDRPWSTH
jgi:hypothetical protein